MLPQINFRYCTHLILIESYIECFTQPTNITVALFSHGMHGLVRRTYQHFCTTCCLHLQASWPRHNIRESFTNYDPRRHQSDHNCGKHLIKIKKKIATLTCGIKYHISSHIDTRGDTLVLWVLILTHWHVQQRNTKRWLVLKQRNRLQTESRAHCTINQHSRNV